MDYKEYSKNWKLEDQIGTRMVFEWLIDIFAVEIYRSDRINEYFEYKNMFRFSLIVNWGSEFFFLVSAFFLADLVEI